MLEKMVSLDTSNPPGNEARIADWVAERLKQEDIPFTETEWAPGRKNITARLAAGSSKNERPVLILAHIDVVGASGQKWASDPHQVVERDGYLYGRGVSDDLGMAALGVETLILLKHSGFTLKRDVILALTGNEESNGTGITYQLEHDPASLDAVLAFNEGGGPEIGSDGKVGMVSVQMAEKLYSNFTLRAQGVTGHSSVPKPGNAIYKIARALDRLAAYHEPPKLSPIMRGYFAARSKFEVGEKSRAMAALGNGKLPAQALKVLEADPVLASKLRTTCVATLVSGGTRVNALPSEAQANVNCRILPDETLEQVLGRLKKVINDPSIEVTGEASGRPGTSALTGEGPEAIAEVSRAIWPGAVIVPSMSGGASDSRWLREKGVAAYGINPIAMTEEDGSRAHGVDERIPVSSIKPGLEFMYRLMVRVSAQPR
jgi:acetylornithine deacetylase/succinyl-diaminopimelate desuccinylase-like protein